MKPPYRIPLRSEVGTPHGLTHVSTFSGCGGSCLGFQWAGFRTLWANDIDPHARTCYSLNFSSPIDGRDIRTLTPETILQAVQLQPGELDVFEGSPPCNAFSTAGTREAGWQTVKKHAGQVQENVEDLFFDWVRLLKGLQPRAFMAENVMMLTRGVALGLFKHIVRDMQAAGYRVEVRNLDAQWLGVPQTRSRAIFLGLRKDLTATLRWPRPLPYRYHIKDALPHIGLLRYVSSGKWPSKDFSMNHPTPAILAQGPTHYRVVERGQFHERKITIAEVKQLCSFPEDFELTGAFHQQFKRCGNSVPPVMAAAIAKTLRDALVP